MNNNEQKQIQNSKKKKLTPLLIICGILAVVGVCAIIMFDDSHTAEIGQTQTMDIQTSYMTMQFPKMYAKNLSHREVTEGNVTSEIFSLAYNETELELFRVCFGEKSTGKLEGYLHTDEGVIPITLAIADYEKLEFPEEDETVQSLYFSMLESVSTVSHSIQSDARFSEYKSVSIGNKADIRLTYFTVSLPESVKCEESTEGGIYQAEFYTTIAAERFILYTVYLGDIDAEAELGTYTVDGVAKPVSVEVGNLDSLEHMSEEDRSGAYLMMETINDVIDVITSSKNFAGVLQPEA